MTGLEITSEVHKPHLNKENQGQSSETVRCIHDGTNQLKMCLVGNDQWCQSFNKGTSVCSPEISGCKIPPKLTVTYKKGDTTIIDTGIKIGDLSGSDDARQVQLGNGIIERNVYECSPKKVGCNYDQTKECDPKGNGCNKLS